MKKEKIIKAFAIYRPTVTVIEPKPNISFRDSFCRSWRERESEIIETTGRYKEVMDEYGCTTLFIEAKIKYEVKREEKITVKETNYIIDTPFLKLFKVEEEYTESEYTEYEGEDIFWIPDTAIYFEERYIPTEETFECIKQEN